MIILKLLTTYDLLGIPRKCRNYHYKVMPFGLKNAGSTHQRMMTRMFELQLGKNIEIYIDDMVVKSKMVSEHLGDL